MSLLLFYKQALFEIRPGQFKKQPPEKWSEIGPTMMEVVELVGSSDGSMEDTICSSSARTFVTRIRGDLSESVNNPKPISVSHTSRPISRRNTIVRRIRGD